jgi:glycosyltransferase involved in cell wall biosynthesis
MKTVFLGLKRAFDYYQVGGVESFIRRVTVQMAQEGHKVDYVLYGDQENKEISPRPGTCLRYFRLFRDALDAIKGYDHVVAIYLLPKDRLQYALFRKRNCKSIRFHLIYFNWPDSSLKRKLYFYESRFIPLNGKLFCISPRQYNYIKKWAENPVRILPPVPENYFLKPQEKPVNNKIQVTFLGRMDPGKGIKEVLEIFNVLKNNGKFKCSIHGIHMPEQKECVDIHNQLRVDNGIEYVEIDRQKYSPSVESFVATVLQKTDIFIQPYRTLSSTIDMPMLLLEAMASLCAVITKPLGNIPDIYGKNEFAINSQGFVPNAIKFLKDVSIDDLARERRRIYGKNQKLNFNTGAVANKFINAIREEKPD